MGKGTGILGENVGPFFSESGGEDYLFPLPNQIAESTPLASIPGEGRTPTNNCLRFPL